MELFVFAVFALGVFIVVVVGWLQYRQGLAVADLIRCVRRQVNGIEIVQGHVLDRVTEARDVAHEIQTRLVDYVPKRVRDGKGRFSK